ncbi:MAG TPA: hypothetical protein VNK67_08560 [Burkholderiales bacterium]|nr:hypothetical protein [Burkholderiales bacterium]
MRVQIFAAAVLLLAGCAALEPARETDGDLERFEPLAADPRVRYGPGAAEYAGRVAQLLPAAIAQVEDAHLLPFAGPVLVHVCGTEACFARHVPRTPRFTAAVIYDNRLLLAPRLFEREPHRLYPILVHELSHLHLGQRLGHYSMALPVWFHEGLASLVAAGGGADLASDAEARAALTAGRHFLPDEVHDETRRKYAGHWGLPVSLFYRQSMLFLDHLRARSEERFGALLLALQQRARFDDAFTAVFGASALELAREFFGRLRCGQADCGDSAASP